MSRVRLVHWKPEEAEPLIEVLREAAHDVEYDGMLKFPASLREWRASPPDAFVIDLSRLPAHGREVAVALRGSKTTWQKPIVFVDGLAEKVEAIRKVLPDAVYTSRARVKSALRQALSHPPDVRIVPAQMMERFGSRTAAQKLGIREGSIVALIDPPRDYAKVVGELPPGVTFQETTRDGCSVTLWFIHDPETYLDGLNRIRDLAGRTKLWVLWRKQASGNNRGVTQPFLRESAVAAGLVDYKICSVNETWSGLAFARKKSS